MTRLLRPYDRQTEQRLSWKPHSERRGRPSARTASPRRLTGACAKQHTVRGWVACGWSLADGRITVTVTVPPGSTAIPEIPIPDPDAVRESEAPTAGRPGVLAVQPCAAGATLRLASGQYAVSADFTPQET